MSCYYCYFLIHISVAVISKELSITICSNRSISIDAFTLKPHAFTLKSLSCPATMARVNCNTGRPSLQGWCRSDERDVPSFILLSQRRNNTKAFRFRSVELSTTQLVTSPPNKTRTTTPDTTPHHRTLAQCAFKCHITVRQWKLPGRCLIPYDTFDHQWDRSLSRP